MKKSGEIAETRALIKDSTQKKGYNPPTSKRYFFNGHLRFLIIMEICEQGAATVTPPAATPAVDDSPVQENTSNNTITIRILAKPGAKHNSVTGSLPFLFLFLLLYLFCHCVS